MNRLFTVIAIVITVYLTGCGDKPAPEPEDKLFNAQREALDAAKEVEGILQSTEEERRKSIDE